jgi:glycosyltransferase involved in cell wall biosynthesis
LPFRLTRRTVTIHLHGGSLHEVLREEPSWVRAAIRVVVDRRRTHGIVLTSSLRQCLEPLVDGPRIRVVANAVEAPPAVNRTRERPGDLQLLFLSTLMPAKGYRELVQAVSGLAQEGVAVRLELCGEPLADEDGGWIASFASDPAVDFRGPIAGSPKWNALSRADILALPSTVPEGQPLAILEGMAAGCAILTTAQGGIVDTVGDAEGAVLGPLAGEPLEAEIRRALIRWSEDPAEVARAGQAARIRFERFHSPDRFIRRWLHAAWRDYVPSSATNGQGAIA